MKRILVHGVNGLQGGATARRLREEGFEVRGAARDPGRSAALAALGVEVVAADLESRLSLRYASEGADAVVLTLPLAWELAAVLRWARHAAEAARACGVARLVLSGIRIPARPSGVAAFELQRAVEAVVRDVGPPCTVLRAPPFMENLLHPGPAIALQEDRVVSTPLPEGLRVAWLAVADLGTWVAAALRRPDLAGATLEPGGPEGLDGPALARELAGALGHPLRHATIPPDRVERALAASVGAPAARGIAQACAWIGERPDTELFSGADPALLPFLSRPLLPLATWARAQRWPGPGPA